MNFFLNNLFVVVYIGALATHLFSFYKDSFSGTRVVLEKLFPRLRIEVYHRIDFLLTPLIGATLAYFLLLPTDLQTAILNGITWHIALTTIIKKAIND